MGDYHRWYWASFGHALANNLRALRKMRGLSQARLAQLSGLSRTVISNLERNESGAKACDPQLSTVYKLAQILYVPPGVLLPQADALIDGPCTASTPHLRRVWPVDEVDTAPFSSGYLTRARANELPKFAGSQNQWADQRADDPGL
ncbi:helix-turn-helix domain-containing protein [Corynebacterium propinquum]|uniref:helix-turn-helix domain-containing protein n=1 Tax=Corynebacterium propinquum TaxID=43769 RepID=UPI000664E5D1|nr:helix-turn-helix transcriptional regulator [Corynebacterium propinquum]MCT1818677.1 helix-turn-helix domain-containing protein [Corynebacterium propinquum]MDK4239734.1 helix-turn-helix transcriptional regulator [Corynebacterium propinquum]MDK8666147.1 helix-turn-helix transcriptional regulator [Corynebacterium propinquum]RUP79228.1 XRE family transcriptional regulator [Corynebacterium propinquum]RUP89423.1 XRE family transcriptional regulator [Corynebacterium propinquum]